MDHTRGIAEQELQQLHQELVDLYATALASIESVGDPQAAFEVATAWQQTVRTLHEQQAMKASRLRARQAVRIREAEALSLAGLADRIGVSKARADQLVNAAKAPQEQEVEATP
jgi:DNA-binding transcriptional regulator YiaG